MHNRSRGNRGLTPAMGALAGPGSGFKPPRFIAAAAGANKTIAPADCHQAFGAGGLITEAALEFVERARKLVHREPLHQHCSALKEERLGAGASRLDSTMLSKRPARLFRVRTVISFTSRP